MAIYAYGDAMTKGLIGVVLSILSLLLLGCAMTESTSGKQAVFSTCGLGFVLPAQSTAARSGGRECAATADKGRTTLPLGGGMTTPGFPLFRPADDGVLTSALPLAPSEASAADTPNPFATSGRGQIASAGCSAGPHYLVTTSRGGAPGFNPFLWWNGRTARVPPATAPIVLPFPCEFSTYLTTIVGALPPTFDTTDPRPLGYHYLAWDAAPNSTPTGLPGTGFAVRSERPLSAPTLHTRIITDGQSSGPVVVLVNDTLPGYSLDLSAADAIRPSIRIDFDSPRRAVGIEYGYVRDPDAPGTIDPTGAKLMAYDERGAFIVGSDGEGCALRSDGSRVPTPFCVRSRLPRSELDDTKVDQRIGVRDAAGGIATVELRFDYSQTEDVSSRRKIIEPQVIARIWHEALPPAAVVQDVVATELRSPGDTAPCNNCIRVPEFMETFGVPLGPRSFNLPYRFDRAAAFLRGFKFQALDLTPHRVDTLQVGLSQDRFEFELGMQRSITLTPIGAVRAGSALPFRAVAFFTLVAWDSRQASLNFSTATSGLTSFAERAREIITSGGSAVQQSHIIFDRGGARLFAGLQSFDMRTDGSVEIDRLDVSPGRQRGFLSPASDNPSLSNRPGGGTWWSFASLLTSPEDRIHSLETDGVLLAARFGGLRLGADSIATLSPADQTATRNALLTGASAVAIPNVGPRTHDEFLFSVDTIRDNLGWAWPLSGDVAFLALNQFSFLPEDPIRELEVELHGDFYDGNVIDWKLGAGISVSPVISGGASAPDPKRAFFALPVFAAINRDGPDLTAQAEWSPLVVRDAALGCSNAYPQNVGTVRNRGPGALLITAIDKGTDVADSYFDYRFQWRGQRLTLADIQNRIPLQLRRDESIEITVTYTPATPAGVPGTALEPHHATLLFQTNSPSTPTIRYAVNGSTSGLTASGQWIGDGLNFGVIPPGRSKRATALLQATGDSRLCVKRLFVAEPALGFHVISASSALEPDILAVQVGCERSSNTLGACSGTTELVADTNAGELRLPISGNVPTSLPQPPPCERPEDYFGGCAE